MKRILPVIACGLVLVAAASFEQQKSEQARAMIAVLEHVKSGQAGGGGGVTPFLLSSVVSGPTKVRHDSALLAEISSVALRLAGPTPPFVLDTFVLTFDAPRRVSEGVYSVRAGGYYASKRSGSCRIGGPSNTYEVRCSGEQCTANVLRQASGSGVCD